MDDNTTTPCGRDAHRAADEGQDHAAPGPCLGAAYEMHAESLMMPNRLLRDGICTSDLLDSCSPEEEVFFYRLLVVCDDFGHADARPSILKAHCFPLKESVTSAKLAAWLAGMAAKGLIRRYTVGGKQFLAVLKWESRVRTHPKYPLPDADGAVWIDAECPQSADRLLTGCAQVTAIGGLGKGKGKGKGADSRTGRELLPLPPTWVPNDATTENLAKEFALRVPEDIDRYVGAFRDACAAKGYRYKDFDAAFRNCVRQDWPGIRKGKPLPVAQRGMVV